MVAGLLIYFFIESIKKVIHHIWLSVGMINKVAWKEEVKKMECKLK